jgi:tetratricopeptide (TPR) repeat protein
LGYWVLSIGWLRHRCRTLLEVDVADDGEASSSRPDTENLASGAAGAVVQAGSITGDVHLHSSLQFASSPFPRELPSVVFGFTDRISELSALDRSLTSATKNASAGSAVIFAISGTAGVGKTAFAAYWAYRVRDRFPDGQLYVNLRGYDPNQALHTGEALTMFLRALGVPNADVPHEIDERASRFRTLVAGRRMLIILDNALTAEQVRPLLPGTPSSVVLVTSRDTLSALVARDGARRIRLDLLPQVQAISLLRKLIGKRVAAEREAAAALAKQCARLPLALRIAAELAIANPTVTLADLVNDLADEQNCLDLLDAGEDPYTAVRAVFSWSYRHLDPAPARMFRTLGLHPGPDFDVHIAAALASVEVPAARRLLEALVRAHLVERIHGGRYQMHDLLRFYAIELETQEEPETGRRHALARLFDYFVHTAAVAMDLVVPYERDRRPVLPPLAEPVSALTDGDHAVGWLEAERINLLAVGAYTVANGWLDHTSNLSSILYRYLDSRAYFDDAVALHTYAVTATQRLGDQTGHSQALHNLGSAHQRLGRYEGALKYLDQALAIARQAGNRAVEGYALSDLGLVHWLLGQYQHAIEHLEQSLVIFRETDNHTGQGQALNNLGLVYGRVERHEEALDNISQALGIFRDTRDRPRQGYAVSDLGMAHWRLERYQEALDYQQQALAIARETGDRSLEAASLNGLGMTTRFIGDPSQVVDYHQQALLIADTIGDRYEQAQARDGLGRAHWNLGHPAEARQYWRQALEIYTDLGVPDAADIREHLTALED